MGRDGRPSARTVLLKGVDGRGFVFYTNYESRKGRDLEVNPRAALVFPWVAQERQVLIEGAVTKVTREESEAYFHSRPLPSQLGAWASAQSTIVSGRAVMEDSLKTLEKKYAGQTVPFLRKVSVFGVRDGGGPQGLPINRTARAAGAAQAAADPAFKLEITVGGSTRTFTRDELAALPARVHAAWLAAGAPQ